MNIRNFKNLFFFIILVALFTACSNDDENPFGAGVPEVVTFPANKISQFKAAGGGTVISEGNSSITARGLVWSDSQGVTLASGVVSVNEGDEIGPFLTTIDRKSETEMFLDSNTTYYIKAYALNDQGVGYGEELSFTTMENFYMEGEPVTDIDGNTYRTVQYEKEGMTWMAENLKATSYQNGDPIPFISDSETWDNDSIGAYCYWENDPSRIEDYGNFYNYFVVNDPRGMCPIGYHVPSSIEWGDLRQHIDDYSSSESSITSQLKEEGTEFWLSGSTNSGNNFSGFSARGAGIRASSVAGNYRFFALVTTFWTTTEYDAGLGGTGIYTFSIGNNDNPLIFGNFNIDNVGYSVRCIKDE